MSTTEVPKNHNFHFLPCGTIRPLREFILSADLRLIVGMQAWRWAGFEFLTLYTYGVLPGIFAWPAGLGDMAIGVTAPLVLSALLRRPGFAAGKSFVACNVSGISDLTVAVSIGALVPLTALFQARRFGR
jgi:hypothetical protein